MSNRLDQKRESELQPERIKTAERVISALGYNVEAVGETGLKFTHKGKTILFYPYSGWYTGASIKDGRGLYNLINQLT